MGGEDRVHTCTSRFSEGRSGAQVGSPAPDKGHDRLAARCTVDSQLHWRSHLSLATFLRLLTGSLSLPREPVCGEFVRELLNSFRKGRDESGASCLPTLMVAAVSAGHGISNYYSSKIDELEARRSRSPLPPLRRAAAPAAFRARLPPLPHPPCGRSLVRWWCARRRRTCGGWRRSATSSTPRCDCCARSCLCCRSRGRTSARSSR